MNIEQLRGVIERNMALDPNDDFGTEKCCPLLTSLLSGSPIVQNGKLVGAVTHVLVDDPTRGYGIFAENMLETAQRVTEENLKEAS